MNDKYLDYFRRYNPLCLLGLHQWVYQMKGVSNKYLIRKCKLCGRIENLKYFSGANGRRRHNVYKWVGK